MTEQPYSLSFTAASLRPELARVVAEHFLNLGDWDLVKRDILATNALQARTPSSGLRLERELRQRLMALTPERPCSPKNPMIAPKQCLANGQ